MLLQQEFAHNKFQMLVCCIMLNQTSNKNVRKVVYDFFNRWPNPQDIINAESEEIKQMIRPLGFYNIRTKRIKRFSYEYINKPWKDIKELHGIGKYASDSYSIFQLNDLTVNPTDKILIKYINGEFINQ